MRVFDTQVNSGKSAFGPDCNLKDYDLGARSMSVSHALVMPTLTHEIPLGDSTEKSCVWEQSPQGVLYKRIMIDSEGRELIENNPRNPYHNHNVQTLEIIRGRNILGGIKYYFAPKVHPKLDTPEEVETILSAPEVKALKINGLAAHTSPEEMPAWLASLANEKGLPIIFHTDFLNEAYTDDRIPEHLRELISANTPKRLLDWALSQNLDRAYFAHAARMDIESLRKISSIGGYVVGLGPDLMLADEPMRLASVPENFLGALLDAVSIDSLLFSTDFAWNVPDRTEWGFYDWASVDRLVESMGLKGLNDSQISRVLFENAEEFFGV